MTECQNPDCPLLAARKAGEQGGPEAEAHVLRLAIVRQIHVIGLLRTRLRELGAEVEDHHPHDIHG